jgi:hypothetical protein
LLQQTALPRRAGTRSAGSIRQTGHREGHHHDHFDRLTEKAVEAVGIFPHVVARPEAVAGMPPLVQAPMTVIKLHGDYLDLDSRNTPQELENYPDENTAERGDFCTVTRSGGQERLSARHESVCWFGLAAWNLQLA